MTMQEEQDRWQRGNHRDVNWQHGPEQEAPASRDTHSRPEAGGPRGKDGDGPGDPALNKARWRRFAFIGLLVFVGVAGAIGYGVYQRQDRNATAQRDLDARRNRVPEVRIEAVKAVTTPREFHLPATTQPFDAATIYARQSGYIDRRLVDIGSVVKAGDLLAVISAPEVDDQLNQARAQLVQMQASLEQNEATRALANVTNNRFTPLVQQGWETKQTGDQNKYNLAAQNAAVDVAKANIQAQKANIARLERAQSYERVIAPFDGVITVRNIDVGSLVAADATSGTPLFAIVRDKILRVQVHVPQEIALQLKPGMEATLDVPEIPGRSFSGKVARTANALDPATRTLLIEADIANPDRTLTSGLYGTVHFLIPRLQPVMIVPSSALIFDQNGMQIAIYSDGEAHLQKVGVGQDDGAQVQIVTGLKPGQEYIVTPPAGIADGAKVKPAKPPSNNKPSSS